MSRHSQHKRNATRAQSLARGILPCLGCTFDAKALQSDALHVKFITGADDAFVMEDADHVMKPRADGCGSAGAGDYRRGCGQGRPRFPGVQRGGSSQTLPGGGVPGVAVKARAE